MGLQEIAVGGIFLSPLLLYAFLGFVITVGVRSVLHGVLGQRTLWHEAWFDLSLFILATAGIAALLSVLSGIA